VSRSRRTSSALASPVIAGWPALLAGAPAVAAPWTVEPAIAVVSTFQSNPQFYTDERHSGAGELLTFSAPFEWQDGRSEVQLRPTVNAGESSGAAGVGVHNRSVDLVSTLGFGRGAWRLNASAARLDLFGTEAANIGAIRPVGYSVSESGGAGLTLQASEREQWDVDLNQSRLGYHSSNAGLIDYRYELLQAQYTRRLDERTQLLLSGSAGRFEPTGRQATSEDRSLQLGGSRHLTESVAVSAMLGRSRVSRLGSAVSDSGDVFAATLSWTHPTVSVVIAAKRSRQPGAYGDLALQTNYSASWNLALSERASVSVFAGLIRTDDTLASFELDRRDYRHAELAASYYLAPQWRLDVRATYAQAVNSATVLRPLATAAVSSGGAVSFNRVFGRTRLL
jgi:hypothetical protein